MWRLWMSCPSARPRCTAQVRRFSARSPARSLIRARRLPLFLPSLTPPARRLLTTITRGLKREYRNNQSHKGNNRNRYAHERHDVRRKAKHEQFYVLHNHGQNEWDHEECQRRHPPEAVPNVDGESQGTP